MTKEHIEITPSTRVGDLLIDSKNEDKFVWKKIIQLCVRTAVRYKKTVQLAVAAYVRKVGRYLVSLC